VLFQVHRWVGLVVGLYFFVSQRRAPRLMWRIDLQRLTYPHLFTPSASGPPVAPEIRTRSRARGYPNHRVSGIARADDQPSGHFSRTRRQGRSFATILADPATGRVLGELPDTGQCVRWQDLHFDLLGGQTGASSTGIGAPVSVDDGP
jgi:uncharacterized iron-regulated membrane protein